MGIIKAKRVVGFGLPRRYTVINSISKDKIPKNCGYVLSSDQLNTLLAENNITIHTDLIYYYSKVPGQLLYAYYSFPNDHIPYYRIYIQSGTVLRREIKNAKKVVSDIVLPEFMAWLNYILKLPENSTLFNKQPTFTATLKNGNLDITKDTLEDCH